MPFNFQSGSLTAVVIYFLVVFSVFIFSFIDTVIGGRKDKTGGNE